MNCLDESNLPVIKWLPCSSGGVIASLPEAALSLISFRAYSGHSWLSSILDYAGIRTPSIAWLAKVQDSREVNFSTMLRLRTKAMAVGVSKCDE